MCLFLLAWLRDKNRQTRWSLAKKKKMLIITRCKRAREYLNRNLLVEFLTNWYSAALQQAIGWFEWCIETAQNFYFLGQGSWCFCCMNSYCKCGTKAIIRMGWEVLPQAYIHSPDLPVFDFHLFFFL